jgi:arginine decarboxylase
MIATPDSTSVQFIRRTAPSLPIGFEVYDNRLFYQGLDLLAFIQRPVNNQGRIEMPTTPMYVRHLPSLRINYEQLYHWFQVARTRTGFPGDLTVAFASKANPAEPVVRTLLQVGAAYECSSSFDVDLARHAAARGWLDRDRIIFANGFKIPGYVQNLIRLRAGGFTHLMPIFDDLDEIAPFAESGLQFDVGIRSRTDSNFLSRFGMVPEDLEQAAMQIMATSNLRLTTFHAMQTIPASRGHGAMDFQDWMIQVQQNVMAVCQEEAVPTPDLVIESGRYLTQDHACKMFRIVKSKVANDGIPFYLIDGSIMSNFPDAWALGDPFTVLPINHWDEPFGPARLAGLTCDPDDVYPTHHMADVPLQLPVNADGLIVGFFDCGAYQETLGGRHGAKHCLLPEGPELVVDDDADDGLSYSYQPAQTATQVLGSLGYSAQP